MSTILKKGLILWLSLSLAVFSPFSNALSFGNWTKTFSKSYGSTTALGFRSAGTVSPSNPAGLLYSGVSVKANPSALSKLYKKVGPTGAFVVAVTAILGAVDWVMDPDNNRVIYQDPEDDVDPEFIYEAYYNPSIVFLNEPNLTSGVDNIKPLILEHLRNRLDGYPDCVITSTSFADLVQRPYGFNNRTKVRNYRLYLSNCGPSSQDFGIFAKRRTEPPNPDKYLGFDAISAEVISSADNGSNSAQNDTRSAADPDGWTLPTYPYGDLEPEIEANKKEEECDPRKDVENSCYGKVGSPLKADPDGTVEVANPDGTTTKYFPDGRIERSGDTGGVNDGIKVTTYPDGTKVTTYPDGSKIITKPDGTITTEEPPAPDPDVKDPDGTSVVQSPDGSITKYFPDGSKKTIQPDGTTRTTKPDGTVIIEAPNGDTVTIAPDGTKTTTKQDGKKEVDTEFKLPKFCDWAKPMCDLAVTITEFLDPPDLPERELPEEEDEIEAVEKEVDFSGQCPAPVSLDYSVLGVSINPSFSFEPVCDAANFINPLMHALGSLSAAYIFFGRGRQS